MHNEIWSLVSYQGAPSWFITFSPTDIKHPLVLYFADTNQEFWNKTEHMNLIANNPVSSTRFFKVMIDMFIEHVVGVGLDRPGLYGEISGYYGIVEQQEYLTLHLHMLVWIKNSLSPQEICNRIMDPTSDLQTAMVEYLESVHQGKFINGTMDIVATDI